MIEPIPHGPLVIGSVLDTDPGAARRRLAALPAACGLVELRADHFDAAALRSVVRDAGRPLLVAVRRPCDGGFHAGGERERRALLRVALEAGATAIDVEWNDGPRDWLETADRSRIVLSDHGSPCTSAALAPLYDAMAATGAARLKIVPLAGEPAQTVAVRELLGRAGGGRRLAAFAMGRAGAISRVLAARWGSWATYGGDAPGRETAAGQLPAAELLDLFRVTEMRDDDPMIVLLGRSVFGSPSPAMHNAALREAGRPGCYLALEADAFATCREAVDRLCVAGRDALAVTIPFKESAAAVATAADDTARSAGAVNTVRLEIGGWAGYNTDGPAAVELVRRGLDPRGATVLVLGAGGTARAVAAAFGAAGSRVVLSNRTEARAERVAIALGADHVSWDASAAVDWDVVVQATPLGGGGEPLPVAERLCGRVVLDAVYGVETPLIRAARRAGLFAIDGFDLLVTQARRQLAIVSGVQASEATMRAAGARWLEARGRHA